MADEHGLKVQFEDMEEEQDSGSDKERVGTSGRGAHGHYRRSRTNKAPRKRTFIANMTKVSALESETLQSAARGVGQGPGGHGMFGGSAGGMGVAPASLRGQGAGGMVPTEVQAQLPWGLASLPTISPPVQLGSKAVPMSVPPMPEPFRYTTHGSMQQYVGEAQVTQAAGVMYPGNPSASFSDLLDGFASFPVHWDIPTNQHQQHLAQHSGYMDQSMQMRPAVGNVNGVPDTTPDSASAAAAAAAAAAVAASMNDSYAGSLARQQAGEERQQAEVLAAQQAMLMAGARAASPPKAGLDLFPELAALADPAPAAAAGPGLTHTHSSGALATSFLPMNHGQLYGQRAVVTGLESYSMMAMGHQGALPLAGGSGGAAKPQASAPAAQIQRAHSMTPAPASERAPQQQAQPAPMLGNHKNGPSSYMMPGSVSTATAAGTGAGSCPSSASDGSTATAPASSVMAGLNPGSGSQVLVSARSAPAPPQQPQAVAQAAIAASLQQRQAALQQQLAMVQAQQAELQQQLAAMAGGSPAAEALQSAGSGSSTLVHKIAEVQLSPATSGSLPHNMRAMTAAATTVAPPAASVPGTRLSSSVPVVAVPVVMAGAVTAQAAAVAPAAALTSVAPAQQAAAGAWGRRGARGGGRAQGNSAARGARGTAGTGAGRGTKRGFTAANGMPFTDALAMPVVAAQQQQAAPSGNAGSGTLPFSIPLHGMSAAGAVVPGGAGQLTVTRLVSVGAYGRVFKGRWGDVDVAVKMMRSPGAGEGLTDADVLCSFRHEASILRKLAHPHIISLRHAQDVEPVCLVQDFAPFGTLSDYIHAAPRAQHPASFGIALAPISDLERAVLRRLARRVAMAPDVLIAELEARSVASLVLPSRQDTQQQGADSLLAKASAHQNVCVLRRYVVLLCLLRDVATALGYLAALPAIDGVPTGSALVHRDVKPSNILLSSQGTALLADFGVAKLLSPSSAPAVSATLGSVGSGSIGHQPVAAPAFSSSHGPVSQSAEEATAAAAVAAAVAASLDARGSGSPRPRHQLHNAHSTGSQHSIGEAMHHAHAGAVTAAAAGLLVTSRSEPGPGVPQAGGDLSAMFDAWAAEGVHDPNKRLRTNAGTPSRSPSSQSLGAEAAAAAGVEPEVLPDHELATGNLGWLDALLTDGAGASPEPPMLPSGVAAPAGDQQQAVLRASSGPDHHGTAHYAAPEDLTRGATYPLTPAADVFSLGTVIWEALSGQRPWGGAHAAAVVDAVTSHAARLPLLPSWSAGLRSVLSRCWSADPAARPSPGEIVAALDAEIRAALGPARF